MNQLEVGLFLRNIIGRLENAVDNAEDQLPEGVEGLRKAASLLFLI